MITLLRLLKSRLPLAIGQRQYRDPVTSFRPTYRPFTMSGAPEINATAQKRRGDSPAGDLAMSENKRVRLEDDLVPLNGTSTSQDGVESVPTVENASAPAVDGESAPQNTAKAERGKKRSHRETEPRNKRGRGGRNRNEEDAARAAGPDAEEEDKPKAPRYPKRQCSLLLGFCGSGYRGMQIQPDHTKTIEGVLFKALVKIGAVSQDNADNPTKVSLARAARTDAGVHAAGNVVSLKMIITIPGVTDLVAKLNEELPPEIRVWGYGRTQNSFNARLSCDSRKYTYFFPTYLLIPPKPGSGLHKVWADHAEKHPDALANSPISYDFWKGTESSTQEEDMARKRSWRVGSEQMEILRNLAKRYEGTHNFHNFTVGRDFKDRSNNRFMKKIEVADPVVYGDTEWISILFHGQSFMLHQIRKMMAILVLGCRMGTPPRIISELYGQRSVFVPKMPSLGLLLEEPLFHSYNEKIGAINANLPASDPFVRPVIDFEIHREKMNAFKEEFIYKNMREVEDRDGLFDSWVRTIDAYAGNDLLYLNLTGAVPEDAVIKHGEKRANPFREKKKFDATSFPVGGSKALDDEDVVESESDDEVLNKRELEEAEG